MGEYDHQLDTKGRMIIPSKFRYDLNERFIITRGLDKCLFGYTLDEWQQIEEKKNGSCEQYGLKTLNED